MLPNILYDHIILDRLTTGCPVYHETYPIKSLIYQINIKKKWNTLGTFGIVSVVAQNITFSDGIYKWSVHSVNLG